MNYNVTNLYGQVNNYYEQYKYKEGSIMMKFDDVIISN